MGSRSCPLSPYEGGVVGHKTCMQNLKKVLGENRAKKERLVGRYKYLRMNLFILTQLNVPIVIVTKSLIDIAIGYSL